MIRITALSKRPGGSFFHEEATTTRADLDVSGAPAFVVTQTHGDRMFGKSSNSDLTYIGGVKWSPSAKFSAGAVFKKGARFPAPVFAGTESPGDAAGPKLVGVIAEIDLHLSAMARPNYNGTPCRKKRLRSSRGGPSRSSWP